MNQNVVSLSRAGRHRGGTRNDGSRARGRTAFEKAINGCIRLGDCRAVLGAYFDVVDGLSSGGCGTLSTTELTTARPLSSVSLDQWVIVEQLVWAGRRRPWSA